MTFRLRIKDAATLQAEDLARTKDVIKARRDASIATGVTIGGIRIETDDLSQVRIVGAAVAVMQDPTLVINWKTGSGHVSLNAETVLVAAQAVRAHIQACFDREAEILGHLNAGEPYDLETGWPGEE